MPLTRSSLFLLILTNLLAKLPQECKRWLAKLDEQEPNRDPTISAIRRDECRDAIRDDLRFSNSSQFRALLFRVEDLLKKKGQSSSTTTERLKLFRKELLQELGYLERDPPQETNYVEKISNADDAETITKALNDSSRKRESDRDKLRDEEDRLRKDYEMFRGINKEENELITGRVSAFATFQGFLWTATALSLNRASGENVDLVGIFIIGLSIVGVFVACCSIHLLYKAGEAINQNVQRWERLLSVHERKNDVLFWGPDIVGHRNGSWNTTLLIPLGFIVGSTINIGLAIALLTRRDAAEIPRLDATVVLINETM